MRDSLCRNRILADSFIPCVDALREKEQVKKVVAKCLQMKMSVIRFRKRTKKSTYQNPSTGGLAITEEDYEDTS